LVEVNIEDTALTDTANEILRGQAGEVLPPLAEAVATRRSTA
jgi:hypothetical protein